MNGNREDTVWNDDMSELLPNVRNAVRAMVFRNNKVLLLKKQYGDVVRYALPGGGQELGETLEMSLERECREEIGCEITIKRLAHVADFFKDRETVPPTVRHLVEFFFICEVPKDYLPQNGIKPDKHQVDVVWADPDELNNITAFPNGLKVSFESSNKPVYLGLLNYEYKYHPVKQT